MDNRTGSHCTAEEVSLDQFLARAIEERVTSFELLVHPDKGKKDLWVYILPFSLDAVGYRQEDAVIVREDAFLWSVAFTDETCRDPVPLISTSPRRPLFQEIAVQAEHYTAYGETTLQIALPWQEVQTFQLKPQETMEGIYAQLEGMGEECRLGKCR